MQIFDITYDYMYYCTMKTRPKFYQLPFSDIEFFDERYLIILEIVEGEVTKLHIVSLPHWLGFQSDKYRYHSVNLN